MQAQDWVSGAVSAAMAEASGQLLSEQTVQDMLRLLSVITADVIPSASGAGISLLSGSGIRLSTAVTDPVVAAADEQQYELNEGPCLTAWATGDTIRIDDVATDPRWPQWAELVRSIGFRSVVSAPMVHGFELFGAMKVYSYQAHAFSAATESMLQRLAEHAALMVISLRTVDEGGPAISAELQESLASRQAITLAQGMLMERNGCDAGQAFSLLVDQARAKGRSMRDEALAVTGARPPVQRPAHPSDD